ncbi:unannotated protein [freshwater metagenome]|uniref:Unannotated protein n=1 Tax=freshwater metagenome TaxID=449393 RepID=A0A6J6F5F5_9ZZZZ
MTYTVVPDTAYWTLISPRTSSAFAIERVYASITSTTQLGRVCGGIAQAESPECTPASSTCSITPPISTSPVWSRMASTSTSVASSRKRSTSTGRSADRPPSLPRLPKPASSAMARARWLRSWTICIARPPSTYDGRTSTGKPTRSTICSACSRSTAVPPGGCGMCSSWHRAFHFSRSSARSIDSGDVPAISSTGSWPESLSGV